MSRLADKPESLIPHFYILMRNPDGTEELAVCALAVPFNEDNEKRSCLTRLGREMFARQKFPAAIALATEAWMTENPPLGIQPRHAANRQETVIVAGATADGQHHLLVVTNIKRDGTDHMIVDGEPRTILLTARFPLLDWFYRGFFENARANSV